MVNKILLSLMAILATVFFLVGLITDDYFTLACIATAGVAAYVIYLSLAIFKDCDL